MMDWMLLWTTTWYFWILTIGVEPRVSWYLCKALFLGQIFCPRSKLSQLYRNIKVTIVLVIQERSNRHSGNDEIWQIYSYFDIFANICLSFISIFFSMYLNLTSGTLKVNFSNHSFLSLDDHSSQKFPQVPKLSITKYSKQALPRNCLRTWKTSFKFFTKMGIICKFFKFLFPAFQIGQQKRSDIID